MTDGTVTSRICYSRDETADVLRGLLRREDDVLILTHVSPDGDCIGAAYALRVLFMSRGRTARVALNGPMPHRLAFLADGDDPAPLTDEESRSFGCVVAIDTASPQQLGGFRSLIPRIDLMIDHHATGQPYAPCYNDPSASSSGEIVYSLYRRLRETGDVPALPDVARRCYAAVLSDTGSFRYSNTTPETHRVAAEMLAEIYSAGDGGLEPDEIGRALFDLSTVRELTAKKLAVENLRLSEGGRLAVTFFTRKMIEEAGLSEEDISGTVEVPRSVEGVVVSLFIRQTEDLRKYRVSSRANGPVDCASVCAAFGGGGHPRAAGCTIEADSPEKALKRMEDAFGAAVRAAC